MSVKIKEILPNECREEYEPYDVYKVEGNIGQIEYHTKAIVKTLENIKNTSITPCLIDKNICLIQYEQCFFENLISELKGRKLLFKRIYLNKSFCSETEKFHIFLIEL
jgi:hypothetical protein